MIDQDLIVLDEKKSFAMINMVLDIDPFSLGQSTAQFIKNEMAFIHKTKVSLETVKHVLKSRKTQEIMAKKIDHHNLKGQAQDYTKMKRDGIVAINNLEIRDIQA